MLFANASTGFNIRSQHTANGNVLLSNDNGYSRANTTQVLSGFVRVTSDQKMYLHIAQTSGSTLATAYNSIAAYKVAGIVV